MQKAGRSYLNCRYEPIDRPINNKDYKELSTKCVDHNLDDSNKNLLKDIAMPRKTTSPDNLKNHFKLVPIYWYLIIVPALLFTFVSLINLCSLLIYRLISLQIVWYNPELIPVNYLPVIGPFAYKLG